MSCKSIALSRALNALEFNFPSLVLPTPSHGEPFLSYLQVRPNALRPSHPTCTPRPIWPQQ